MPLDKKVEVPKVSFMLVTQLLIYTEDGKRGWVPLYAMMPTKEETTEEAVRLVKEQIEKGEEAVGLLLQLKQYYDTVKQ